MLFVVVVVVVFGVVYCLRSVYDGEGRHACVAFVFCQVVLLNIITLLFSLAMHPFV